MSKQSSHENRDCSHGEMWCNSGCNVGKQAVVMRTNCSMLSAGNSD